MRTRGALVAAICLFGAVQASAQEVQPIPEPLASRPHYSAVGLASWYGRELHGHATANGEIFDMRSLTAAHRSMPLPCYARVTNLANGRSIIVRVNDRGPFVRNRIVDVSARVAGLLEFNRSGVTKVRVDYVGKAPPVGADGLSLLASLRIPGAPAAARPAPESGESVVARTVDPPKLSQSLFSPAKPTALAYAEADRVADRDGYGAKGSESRSPYGDLITPAAWTFAAQTTASAAP